MPLHIRNAPTRLMKQLEYGKGYEYAHDAPDAVTGMDCLPPALQGRQFYRPTDRGFEKEIGRRLEAWREIKKKRRELEKRVDGLRLCIQCSDGRRCDNCLPFSAWTLPKVADEPCFPCSCSANHQHDWRTSVYRSEGLANGVARFSPRSRVMIADDIEISVASERLHFFDAGTHQAPGGCSSTG